MAGVLDPLDVPKHRLEELRDELDYECDIPVTLRQLREAVLRGELVPTKLSNKNYFSLRDGLDWVAAQKGRKRGEGMRRGEGNGARARAAESAATPP